MILSSDDNLMRGDAVQNGASRSLRAALWRFAELAHLIRPQKCRYGNTGNAEVPVER